MARRTKDEAQATREHLINTAEQVFLARGVARSSLQGIAEAAGLTRGAIYWHFADKLALFNALMARVDLPLQQAMAEADRLLQRPGPAPTAPPSVGRCTDGGAANLPTNPPANPPVSTSANLPTNPPANAPANPMALLRSLALAPFALIQADAHAQRVFTILLHRTEYVGDLAPLVARQNGALHDCVQQMARLFQAAQDQGLLAPSHNPRSAAIALVALIDGLLRLCTLAPTGPGLAPHDSEFDSASPQAAAALAIDALLNGLQHSA